MLVEGDTISNTAEWVYVFSVSLLPLFLTKSLWKPYSSLVHLHLHSDGKPPTGLSQTKHLEDPKSFAELGPQRALCCPEML